MRIEVIMPQLGESIVEGTVVEWMKEVGDHVDRDEDIFTLSTDKVDAEIPAPAAGVLVEILAQVGDVVEVGKPVAYIETDASAAASAPAPAPAAAPAAPAPVEKAAPAPAVKAAPATSKPGKATRVSPVVNNIAAEHGITDLSVINGTGSQGRVTKKDILAFIAAGGQKAAPAAKAAPKAASVANFEGVPAGWEPALVKQSRVHRYDGDRAEPMTRIQSAMAAAMLDSKRTAAHTYTMWEADMTEVDKVRRALKDDFAAKGVKLTFTAFFVAAAVSALQKFPIMNAAIDGNEIVYRRDINVGVAAASDDGLIVPVLKGADNLNLFGIAKSINDLGGRAKNRNLKPSDIEGGTFTVSNAGIWGSVVGFPVLVSPQVGIIAIGGIKKRVVVGDDDSMRIRKMCNITLTFDHRIIDGATADGFMAHLTQMLGGWS